jgi:predicted TIM-barrel fold metal-dependent hydrolase
MAVMQPGTREWLDQVAEPIIDPDLAIVDPHHHLWPPGGLLPYGTAELRADTGSGHNVVKTVFVECSAGYRSAGPEHLRPVGETGFVAAAAAELRRAAPAGPPIAAIVAHADLRAGDRLDEVLDAHEQAGRGLFRGIRHAGSRAVEPEVMMIPGRAPEGLYADADFRAGLRRLGERGLSYDTWHYHYQNGDFADLARAVPETTLVLDHFGTPVGVGRFEAKRDEVFEVWKRDIAEIARCDNVVAKLGGLAMPDNGFGWHLAERPPSSDEFVAAQARYYHHAIDCFGPDRCMFESNFPVDKLSLSYAVLWNALKKIAAGSSPDERTALFSGTASRVYRL